ncbi:MAG: phosphate ABC transporter permease subunit PstC [Bacteroidales bacterium]|nr:phosphate ABC transporter permease subunit PstC [Bacteroidales bacterium]
MSLLRRRILKDRVLGKTMLVLTVLSLLALLIMAAGLLYKSSDILAVHSLKDLLGSTEWSPLSGRFGFLSFILSSVYVTLLSVVLAVPVAILTALYLTERAHPLVKKIIFPVLDILAGIPSVVYGLWGTLIVVPWIADTLGPHFVDYTSGYTLLAGGIVLAIMIVPLLVSLFVELFSIIPRDLKEASASLGATRWQISRSIVLRKAAPGIIAAVVLAVSKAFGETLAVLMVCGNMVGVPHSLFDGAYPLPALIANNYGEMLSLPMYESALMFAALVLFVIILLFNALSRVVLQNVEKKFKL